LAVSVLLLSTVYQCITWLLRFSGAGLGRTTGSDHFNAFPVSIIICAHRAHKQLEYNLPFVLCQSYPEWELIVVNDGGDFATDDLLKNYQSAYPNLRTVSIEKKRTGKKDAIAAGVASARYSWLLLTDADCRPATTQWIWTMMATRSKTTQLVIGYSPIEKKIGLRNELIRFESLFTAIQYFSAARSGHVYMGVGRNLLYHKSLFSLTNLVPEHPSGDDDLFIQRVATAEVTEVCAEPAAWVWTDAAISWKTFFMQKMRHYSASRHYSLKSQTRLTLYFVSLGVFYAGIIMSLATGLTIPAITLFILRTTCMIPVFRTEANGGGQPDLQLKFIYLEPVYLLFICIQLPFLLFYKNHRFWN